MAISYFCHDTKRRGPRLNVIMTLIFRKYFGSISLRLFFFCPDILKLKTRKGLALQDILTQIHTYVHRGWLLTLCFQYCNHSLSILYSLCSGFSSQGQNDFVGEDGECGVSWRWVMCLAAISSSLQLLQRTGNKSWVYVVENCMY